MGAIINVRLPAAEVELGVRVASLPEVVIDVEQLASQTSDDVLPLLWIRADDFTAVDEALEDDPTVEGFDVIGSFDHRRLYRMEWADTAESTIRTLRTAGGYVRNAKVIDGEWSIEVLFPDRDDLSRMYDVANDADIPLTVDSIYELSDEGGRPNGLTTEQQETLVAAFEHGYYDVPREVSLVDLAEKLDISHQALSERLRRAHETLVDASVNGHVMDGTTEAPRPTDQ